jgi:hypothetical protein
MADEQVTRVIEAAQEWIRRVFSEASDTDPETATAAREHRASDCQWCPLCQFAGVLRGERPELTAKLAEAGTNLLAVFRALTEPAGSSGDPAGTTSPDDASSDASGDDGAGR